MVRPKPRTLSFMSQAGKQHDLSEYILIAQQSSWATSFSYLQPLWLCSAHQNPGSAQAWHCYQRDDTCVWHDQVDDVLSLVEELKGEEERLRSTGDYESNQPVETLPSLREMQRMEVQQQSKEPWPFWRGHKRQEGMEKSPYINNKMLAKENPHLLLDVEGNISSRMTIMRSLMTSLSWSLSIRTVILRATRSWVGRQEWGAEQTPCNPGGSN